MSNYGFIWTDGTDISDAELKNIIISSEHPCLKFAESGTGSVTYTHDGGYQDVLIKAHNLGYEPMFYFATQWLDINTNNLVTNYRRGPFTDSLLGRSIYFTANAYSTTTQLRLSIGSFTGSGAKSVTAKYMYFIYYDPDL